MSQTPALPTTDVLAGWVTDARRRTLELTDDLDDGQLMGQRLGTVNPLLWEVGHLAWFQEKWSLRHPRHEESLLPGADALYDSAAVATARGGICRCRRASRRSATRPRSSGGCSSAWRTGPAATGAISRC